MNDDIRRFCQLGPCGVFALFWCLHLYVSVAQRGNSYLKIIAAWEGSTIEQSGLRRIWNMRNCTALRGKADIGGFYISNGSNTPFSFSEQINMNFCLFFPPSLIGPEKSASSVVHYSEFCQCWFLRDFCHTQGSPPKELLFDQLVNN